LTSDSKPLKALKMVMRAAVPKVMATTLTHEMMLMACVDFFALKYLQENLRIIPVVMVFALHLFF
jgi:hypothetical protein